MANSNTQWTSDNIGEDSGVLNIECHRKAEEELKETPENYKKELASLQTMILSKLICDFQFILFHHQYLLHRRYKSACT